MPLRQMPNGAYVNVPDDITPEGMAKLTRQFAAKTTAAPRAPADPRSRREREDGEYIAGAVNDLKNNRLYGDKGVVGHVYRGLDAVAHGASFGLDDVVASAGDAITGGAAEAVKKGDIGEIPRRFRNNRAALKEYRRSLASDHAIDNTAGAIIGAIKSPLGAETGIAKASDGLLKLAAKTGPKAAEGVRRVRQAGNLITSTKPVQALSKAANSSIGTGARAGFNQAAAAAAVDGKAPQDILNEGGMGALFGGAAAGVLRGGQAAYGLLRDRAPEQASRVAHERIAQILNKSENPTTGKPFTPEEIRNEVRATNAKGGSAVMGDLMPETQALTSQLVKTGVSGASSVANRAEQRAASAVDRFDTQVRKVLGIDSKDPDAFDLTKMLKSTRKAAGQRDYSDEVMDRQLAWNDKLEDLFSSKNPAIMDALPGAEKLVRIDGGDVMQLAFSKEGTKMQEVPSMRTMQYITQALDDVVGNAMKKDGGLNIARAYSKVNRELKDALAEANPEFAAANATQRDLFERSQSVELGAGIIKALQSGNARQVLEQIKAAGTHRDELKIAFADALLHLREAGDPVKIMRRMMRSDDQRKVLADLFGGNKNLAEFEKFMRREARSARADKLVTGAHNAPSAKVSTESPGEALSDAALGVARGGVFGPLSAVSALSRAGREAKKLSKSLSPSAQAALLKILESDGERLSKVKAIPRYQRLKERRMRRAAAAAGKAPTGIISGYSEE